MLDTSGARIGSIFSREALNIAIKMYEQIRRRNDCAVVAKNAGCSIEQIQIVKHYVFFENHFNSVGEFERFTPAYDMAESWHRLSERSSKNVQFHDKLMIMHELTEIQILLSSSNMTQSEAHRQANLKYNYQQASDNYYKNKGIAVN